VQSKLDTAPLSFRHCGSKWQYCIIGNFCSQTVVDAEDGAIQGLCTEFGCISVTTVVRRIKTFRSTKDQIYDGGPIIYYNTIVLQLPTVFSTVTCCTVL
jgi:hypothetical protein